MQKRSEAAEQDRPSKPNIANGEVAISMAFCVMLGKGL